MVYQSWALRFLGLSLIAFLCSCQNAGDKEPSSEFDVVLIGGGIMSATLGSLLENFDPNLTFAMYEELPEVAMESSAAWNNAGTGHAGYSELNYTPVESNGSVNIKKAVDINEAFELSMEFWAYMVENKKLPAPHLFINRVPHISFVWGDENISFLKKRHEALIKNPLFYGMEYTENKNTIKNWVPLVMDGREGSQKVAATRYLVGTDIDFGSLTKEMFKYLDSSGKAKLSLNHKVVGLKQMPDKRWQIKIKNLDSKKHFHVLAKFVFIGAGGGSLLLLQDSGIPEADMFGGFPVGGQWLVTDNEALIAKHDAKVYGKASVGSPPMSVPHLDTRYIDGKRALLFGPFATFSTKFLKYGSWTNLFSSINFSNVLPIMEVGWKNFDLTKYLIEQVLLKPDQRLAALKEYFPEAELKDWTLKTAGQRVQVIKNDPKTGAVLQFGTEIVGSKDKTLQALLGASPGASVAVDAMLKIITSSFKEQMASPEWQAKVKKMLPSYGKKLADDVELLHRVRNWNQKVLKLQTH